MRWLPDFTLAMLSRIPGCRRRHPGWYPAAEEAHSACWIDSSRAPAPSRTPPTASSGRSVVAAARACSGSRPGSVVVAAICVVLAGILVFAGIEATDNPTALTMTPDQVAQADDLGSRTYATISGFVAATYVETYTDDNGNGTQEAGETGSSWYYFLVDPDHEVGRHDPEPRPRPRTCSRTRRPGSSSRMPSYLKEDLDFFTEEATSLSFALDPSQVHRCHGARQRDHAASSTSRERSPRR